MRFESHPQRPSALGTERRAVPGAWWLALAIAIGLGQGCGSVTPASFSAKPPRVNVVATRAISVVATLHEVPASRLNASGFTFDIDRDEFSREMARLLVESFEEAGVEMGGQPEIGVRVDYLDYMFQGPCLLDYRVSLGDDVVFGAQAEGRSSSYSTACRKAFEHAVSAIAGDPRTAEFLRRE